MLFLDVYLTDSCYRICGFKRMTPTVIRPEEVSADIFFSTHSHPDHLDPDTLAIIAGNGARRKNVFTGEVVKVWMG